MSKLILASASPRRAELLTRIGMDFTVITSTCKEQITSSMPEDVVCELSALKAEDVWNRAGSPESIVIGADTIVAYGGRILGKPGDKRKACEMLAMLSGNTHQVYTGVTLVYEKGGEVKRSSFYEKTEVHFYPMSREEIEAYVNTGDPLDKAGAYGIQGACAAYIRGIEGDYYNVVGLPVGRLYQELKRIMKDEKYQEDEMRQTRINLR